VHIACGQLRYLIPMRCRSRLCRHALPPQPAWVAACVQSLSLWSKHFCSQGQHSTGYDIKKFHASCIGKKALQNPDHLPAVGTMPQGKEESLRRSTAWAAATALSCTPAAHCAEKPFSILLVGAHPRRGGPCRVESSAPPTSLPGWPGWRPLRPWEPPPTSWRCSRCEGSRTNTEEGSSCEG
jgi:hypothetical protein